MRRNSTPIVLVHLGKDVGTLSYGPAMTSHGCPNVQLVMLADFMASSETIEEFCGRTWRSVSEFRGRLEAVSVGELRAARHLIDCDGSASDGGQYLGQGLGQGVGDDSRGHVQGSGVEVPIGPDGRGDGLVA